MAAARRGSAGTAGCRCCADNCRSRAMAIRHGGLPAERSSGPAGQAAGLRRAEGQWLRATAAASTAAR
ncbi:hypothetical protein [Paenibacillus durus]|uniref:hypothetical protein n=1 Tax=Paenibacillus durus TaxID=44251 RepID=UPI0012E04E56|nr:hypothetical protein [Paenibacillus durus]